MSSIKFGTDGWRGLIAKDYTFENLTTISIATALYFQKHEKVSGGVAVGFDTRFMSKDFARFVAEIFASLGLKTFVADSFVSSPALSLFVQRNKLAGGVMITASHNPPAWNGFKIKADYGGSAHPEILNLVESKLDEAEHFDFTKGNYADLISKGLIVESSIREFYLAELRSKINITAIAASGFKIAHNAMYGAGQGLLKTLLPNVTNYHCEENPSFGGINPEPIPNNIQDFAAFIRENKLDVGVVNDGDADRLGMLDENGDFVDSHLILSLLLKYLTEDLNMKGEVVKTFSTTVMLDKICTQHCLTLHTTKIGFKYICQLMLERDILMGGEESGGIGITSHIPERDGVFAGLLVLEIMARKKKLLSELVKDLYREYGQLYYRRIDKHLTEAEKEKVIDIVKTGELRGIGGMAVTNFSDLDGYKYFFDGGWLLFRPSGTEPVLRLYSEADSFEKVSAALDFASNLK